MSRVWNLASSVAPSLSSGQLSRAQCFKLHISNWCLEGKSSACIFLGRKLVAPAMPVPLRRGISTNCIKSELESSEEKEKIPFGYTRKDVILIGVGIIVAGVALKYGLEAAGLDELQAGNVVQITFVLGLMLAWTFTYVFRVGNKEMTYVKQLKDYEDAVMKKRLEELPETELEAMLAEVEEEKRRLREKRAKGKQE